LFRPESRRRHLQPTATSSFNLIQLRASTLQEVRLQPCGRLRGSVAQGCNLFIYSAFQERFFMLGRRGYFLQPRSGLNSYGVRGRGGGIFYSELRFDCTGNQYKSPFGGGKASLIIYIRIRAEMQKKFNRFTTFCHVCASIYKMD